MAMSVQIDWPDDDAILVLAGEENGSVAAMARRIGENYQSLRAHLITRGLLDQVKATRTRRAVNDRGVRGPAGLEVRGDDVIIDSTDLTALADTDALLRRRGMDPEEWEVTGASVTEWGRDPDTGEPYQRLKVTCRRRRSMESLLIPEPVKAIRPPKARTGKTRPRLGFIVSDFHAPYHDPGLFACFLRFLEDVQPDFGILAGDILDLPEPSKHRRNPAWFVTPGDCIRSGFRDILAPIRQAAPDTELELLVGNHDVRLRNWLLTHQPDLADITPGDSDIPALSMRHLLALDKLHIRAVEPQGEYSDGFIDVCRNLKVIHGEKTGRNPADGELQRYGHSISFGHTHHKESAFLTRWDWDGPAVSTGLNVGCMCLIADGLGYTRKPNWQQGFGVVRVWPDGQFHLEHANYVNGHLLWGDRRWDAPTLEAKVAA